MSEIVLMKTASGALIPCDQQGIERVTKMKIGAGLRASVKKLNNVAFHRKLFALFNVAFDAWEPGEKTYKGIRVEKEFERFRKDLTILAGHYETAIDLNGDVRLTAKSLNFDVMDQDERERLYSAVINVVLSRILTNYTRADLDAVVENVLRFA